MFSERFADPTNLPQGGTAPDCAFSPDGNYLAVACALGTQPFVVYPWSATGFGTKLSDPADFTTPPCSNGFSVAWSPDGAWLAGGMASRFLRVWPFAAGFTGTGVPIPAETLNGTWNDICFSPDGLHLAGAYSPSAGPGLVVYGWSGGTFGTRHVPPPGVLPVPSAFTGCAWSPDGAFVALTFNAAPYVAVFNWNNATGIGAKVADPSFALSSNANKAAFSPDGAYLAVTHNGAPYCTVYQWSPSGFGSNLVNPKWIGGLGIACGLGGSGRSVQWSDDGDFIGISHNGSNGFSVYRWAAGWGDPVSLSGGTGIAFNPVRGDIAATGTLSPFVAGYGA